MKIEIFCAAVARLIERILQSFSQFRIKLARMAKPAGNTLCSNLIPALQRGREKPSKTLNFDFTEARWVESRARTFALFECFNLTRIIIAIPVHNRIHQYYVYIYILI